MASTTALTVITNAFNILNVFMPGDSIPSADSSFALTLLNNMMGQWNLQSLTRPITSREVFSLVAGRGGPADPGNGGSGPYTIGPGGNFNTTQSPSQQDILGAGLLLASSTPSVEIPRAIYTDEAYEAIRLKDLQSILFTGIYYSPTFAAGLGSINLWPVPNTAANSLVLYRLQQLAGFLSLAANYDLPTGSDKAIADNLVMELADPYGRTPTPTMERKAIMSLAVLKRANMKMNDLAVDPMFTQSGKHGGSSGHGYDIIAGSGG